MSPTTRHLYDYAKENLPNIYEHLRDLDTSLAELHASGQILQANRLQLVQEIAKYLKLTAAEKQEISFHG